MAADVIKPTVYLVESDERSRNRLGTLILKLDVKIEPFTCGEDFLNAIEDKQCACLVANVRLPGCSGVELLEYVKLLNMSLPAVLLDDVGSVETAVEVMRAGAIDYIETPFVTHCLANAVRSALNRSLEVNSVD